MAWVTWRQHRIALAGAAALLGALALYLGLAGLQVHRNWTAAVACHPASSGACGALVGYFISDWQPAQIIAVALHAVPPLIGAFIGAPVLAREMETGTLGHQPAVVRQGRPAGQPVRAQPGPPGGAATGRGEGRGRDPAG
jgi:hypothetical protein